MSTEEKLVLQQWKVNQICLFSKLGSYEGLSAVEADIRKGRQDNQKAISPEIRYVFSGRKYYKFFFLKQAVSAKDGVTNPKEWITLVQFLLQ